ERALRGSIRSHGSWYPRPFGANLRHLCAERRTSRPARPPSRYLRRPTRFRPRRSLVRTARTIAALGGIAAVLAALAASPAGGSVRHSIAAFAENAGAVNGIKASRAPKPGRLVPLGRNAKLPSSVVPTVRWPP